MGGYASLLQAFLPVHASLLMDGDHAVIYEADIDGDGANEITGAYRWYGEIYLLTLKQFNQGWRVIAHIRGRGYDISYLYVAPVTGRGLVNIIAGWQVRETWSELAIYEWTQNGVREITRPGIYFSGIEVEDMPVLDGQYEIALWLRENEEMYQLGVYRWRNNSLEPAADLYPYYRKKVARYYQEKMKEIPNQALLSTGTATSLTAPPMLKGEWPQLREELSNMRAAYLYRASIQTLQGEKWGYIDDGGRFILPPQYDDALRFQANGLAVVRVGRVFGVIDASGAFVVKPRYGTISEFSEGRAAVTDNRGFHVIDEKGNVLTSKPYSYIGTYKEGRAIYAHTNQQGKYLYGYLDEQGREVIPLSYELARDFKGGKAVVQISDSQFALVDRSGTIVHTYPYAFVGDIGEGLLAFQEKSDSRYGFIDETGHVVIEPKYTGAQTFQEGRAVVNTAENYMNAFGLIDRNGRLIIKPAYNDILPLGEGRLAVGKALDEKQPFIGSRYAITDTSGLFLTDFVYYDVGNYEKGLASVDDGRNTFFIGKNGKAETGLPIVHGNGTVRIVGNLIEANVDNRLSYRNRFGDVVWQQNRTIRLNNLYTVREEKYKPNRHYLVYYPRIEGMENKAAQEEVNQELKRLSQVKPIDSTAQQYSYTGDCSLSLFQKHLLVLELNGYKFPFGAAHGMPTKVYVHIDVRDGTLYQLEDLFIKDSNYVKVLSDIIKQQIETENQYSYVFPDAYKGIQADQPFYVTDKALYIYFKPYEIAPFVAGFPTFTIPYIRIRDILHTQGKFWRAFH